MDTLMSKILISVFTFFGSLLPILPCSKGRTRECKSDIDCSGIQNTTCMNDPRDNKMRCLCRDSSAPINGACPNRPRALHTQCNYDHECIEGAMCKTTNSTTGTSTAKTCVCKEEYVERDHLCNSAMSLMLPSLISASAISLAIHYLGSRYRHLL